MKKTAFFLILFFLLSCSAKKEMTERPPQPVPPAPEKPAPTPPPEPKYRTVFECSDDTNAVFNSCGLDVQPFLRPVFFDIDGDGSPEMIAGTKSGKILLYKNSGPAGKPRWKIVEGYFRGVAAGAFSAPAVGDIDGDGTPELLMGTGGFSGDSGRVIIYKNTGSAAEPVWQRLEGVDIRVGNDATPALVYPGNDRRPDLIVGNSSGHLFFFRNLSRGSHISFVERKGYFRGVNLGMYVVPAAALQGKGVVIVAGNSMGKLYLLENRGGRAAWRKTALRLSFESFAAPTFIGGKASDLVVAEGDGKLHYFRNVKGDFHSWEEVPGYFGQRIITGLACSPAIAEIGDESIMVVGNINGELKLFRRAPSAEGLPWKEEEGFFTGIKLSGFSRGVLTVWDGRHLLIAGQQNGILQAYLNTGGDERPHWVEQKDFFVGLPRMYHAAPSVFDLDGDGRWELVVGDADGYVHAFKYRVSGDGVPVWTEMKGTFGSVKVGRFAVPSLFREEGKLYLAAGESDGKVALFAADNGKEDRPVFRKYDYLRGIRVRNHSSPSVTPSTRGMEVSVGDYDGNLRHFACRTTLEKIDSR